MDLIDELMDAMELNDFKRIQQALDQGANPNTLYDDGTTPLYFAALGDDLLNAVARVRLLLRAGAHVAAEQPADGHTSVHSAAEAGNIEALKLLLDADGKCALGKFDYISRTPLICAVHKRHLEAAKLLISMGSDVNAHDEPRIGDPAISRAVDEKDEEMVKLLLSAGADATLRGWMQLSALDRAADWRESTRHPELQRIYAMLESAARHPAVARGGKSNVATPAPARRRGR